MTINCRIIETRIEGTPTYGLIFRRGEHQLCVIEDITLDRARIEALCATINGSDLDELHIHDVVEDAVEMWA